MSAGPVEGFQRHFLGDRAIERFQILGYFSRISARRSDSVRDLTSEVRGSQGEAFKALRTAYKTFNRAKTHGNSRALAKQIVKVAIQKQPNTMSPDWDTVNKTGQLTNAVLSNWLRDGKRRTLEEDIRAELETQLDAFRNQQRIRQQLNHEISDAFHNRQCERQQVNHEIVEFKRFLLQIQGESAEPITHILQEKKLVQAKEMASCIEETKEEREELKADLKAVQCRIDRFKGRPRPPKDPRIARELQWSPQQHERLVEEYDEAKEEYLRELLPRECRLRNAIKDYDCRLNMLSSQIDRYDLDGISGQAKNIIDKASNKGMTVTPEELVPDALPAESRSTLIQAIRSFHSTRESRVTPKERIEDKLDKEFWAAQLQRVCQEDGKFKYGLPEEEIPHEEKPSLNAGVAFMQGRRDSMEDDHLMEEFLIKNQPARLFGVFDGHGGSEASRFVRENLQTYLMKNLGKFGTTQEGVFNALKATFVELDQDMPAESNRAGTTATVAFIYDGEIWVANAGDSRTVLDYHGTPVQLSEDAKPDIEKYKRGVEKRGGEVVNYMGTPYVGGAIGVARAIGDHHVKGKNQHCCISPRPKIVQTSEEEGTHLILACNGLWNVASTEQVVRAVQADDGASPGEIAQSLVWSAYSAGSRDNISAMVIRLGDDRERYAYRLKGLVNVFE